METAVSLSDAEFVRLKEFIYSGYGIKITDVKRTMLEVRLRKRLRALGFSTFAQYCDHLFSPTGISNEVTHMINQVTTNKTDFFRESSHFDYLTNRVLPEFACSRNAISIWSAGCSTGEEPYTLAMVMEEYRATHSGPDYMILATDISTDVLEKAKLAIYPEERITPIDPLLRKKYLLRGKRAKEGLYRITPGLRTHVRFRQLNFMDGDFGFREKIDIIFCRNVVIYFDKSTQERLLNHFCRYLHPDGYIFMGHSETILGMDVPLVGVAPTVYKMRRK